MTTPRPITRRRPAAGVLLAAAATLACTPKRSPTLEPLCADGIMTRKVAATVDTVRPPAGPDLAAAKGTRFELRLTFARPSARQSAAFCTGTIGTALVAGTIPDRIRSATSSVGAASWRIEGDTVFLDLNPGTRDNNVFLVLPLHGGRGHWGLSTFAGEVAGGETTFIP